MTIQRGLKAIGTFSYQTAVCGRGAFTNSLFNQRFDRLQAANGSNGFPRLRRMITANELN